MASFDPYWSYPPDQRLTKDDLANPIITEILDSDEEDEEDDEPTNH